jgi:two-component system, LytTR family, response regulator
MRSTNPMPKRLAGLRLIIARTMDSQGGRWLWVCVGVAAWALATLLSTAQGMLFAAFSGRPQGWCDTLGYTAAIFAVWAALAPVMLLVADRVVAARLPRWRELVVAVLGYVLTTAVHVVLFVALFWPVYGAGLANPAAMILPVLLANLDKSVIAYIALMAAALFRRRLRETPHLPVATAKKAPSAGLWIRVGGSARLVRFEDIDWIAAAGDYAEVHTGGRSLLMDRSLAALAEELPADFTRIHRGAIVRLDRISELRSIGRGDAHVLLRNGQTLRLSRRYRKNLSTFLPS